MVGAKERYEKLTVHREQFLQRARHNAMLTIPPLMPLDGHDGKSHLIEPYQSTGATGVVGLSSRVTMALIPAGRPHLRLDVSPQKLLELNAEVPPAVNQELAKMERLIQGAVEKANWRSRTLDIMQQLIVAGSCTEEFLEDNSIRVHRLDNFVWRRDYRGTVLECVLIERWDKATLPESLGSVAAPNSTDAKDDDDIEVYTWIRLASDGVYEVSKETSEGQVVSDMITYTAEGLPFLFLRWSSTPGEDYGRSKVEEVIADLRSLDSLSKQGLEQSGMAAMNFVMVRPGANSNGLRNRLSRMNNGDIVVGDPESVEVKQFANQSGYQITQDSIQRLTESISRTFLLLSPQQRNAERVTATEIERDIQELESTLGGTFSALSLEMLERRTFLLMENMKTRGEFPPDTEGIDATILTGLEALSRERDVGRGVQAAQILQQFGDEGIRRVKLDVILDRIMTGLGFPDAVRPEEEVKAEQQQQMEQQQQAQMAQSAVGPAINAAAAQGGEGG